MANSPNGQFVAVCGNGEYIIYFALNLIKNHFGSADEVVNDIVQEIIPLAMAIVTYTSTANAQGTKVGSPYLPA